MAKDGEAVDARIAAAVGAFVQGDRVNVSAICRELGTTRTTFYKYVARFRAEGVDGLFPRTRRPGRSPSRLPAEVEDLLVQLRKEERDGGWDYGADAVLLRLRTEPGRWTYETPLPARSSVNRVFADRGLLEPVPSRAPKHSHHRFARDQVNDLWQFDGFEWHTGDGTTVMVLHLIDDCSRLDLALQVARSENSIEVWDTFGVAADRYGLPRQVLTDNGRAFSGRRRGWTSAFEANLTALGIDAITSTPGHPQTCGKCERAHARVLKWLRRQPVTHTPAQLQAQLDTYRTKHNTRPSQVHEGISPQQRFDQGPMSRPAGNLLPALSIVRAPVSPSGTIAVDNTMIGIGRQHAHTTATAFRQGDLVSVFVADQYLRTLTLDRSRRYQPQHHGIP